MAAKLRAKNATGQSFSSLPLHDPERLRLWLIALLLAELSL